MKMDEKYEVILYRTETYADALFRGSPLELCVRQYGDKLTLPNTARIVESHGWFNSMNEVKDWIDNYQATHRFRNRIRNI
jgi:hypothetical protein